MNFKRFNRFTILSLFLGAVLFTMSCNPEEDDPVAAPEASFTAEVNGAVVTLTNTSTGEGNTFAWDFGDGTSATQESPEKTYSEAGTYTIELTVTNDGGTDTASDEVVITDAAVDDEAPIITLLGAADTTILVGQTWNDPGANAMDNVDMDLTSSIVVTGSVDTSTEGEYVLSYDVTDNQGNEATTVTRTVTVAADAEKPVVTLVGDAQISLEIGGDFTDPGATATDNVDGDLTDSITVVGMVNTLQPAVYELKYAVEDAAGNVSDTVVRTVTVTFDDGLLTNGDFETGDGTGWTGNALDVRTEGGNSFSFANVENPDPNQPFLVNLSQVVPMQSGNVYRLSFNASSDVERYILAGIGLNEAPFTNVNDTVRLTTETQRFDYEFTANFGSDNSRILFDMASEAGVVVIDNVSLELVSEYTAGLPIDFEAQEIIASPFNGASFEFATDPADANNTVGQITNIGAAFEGVTFQLGTDIDLSTDKQITIQFNTSTAGVPVLLKLEGATPIELPQTAATTGWQELNFDFSGQTGTFNGVTIFVDGPGSTAGTFYVDDIIQEAAPGGGSGGGGGGTPGANLAVNGDFEAGDVSDWESFPTSASTFEAVTTNPSAGTYAGRLQNTATGSAAIIKQANLAVGTVNAGDQIQITFDARGQGNAGGVSFAEFFSEISGGGTSSNEILGGGPLALDADPAVWKSFSFTVTAGSDVSGGITLQLTATTGGDASSEMEVFFDNVEISIVQ